VKIFRDTPGTAPSFSSETLTPIASNTPRKTNARDTPQTLGYISAVYTPHSSSTIGERQNVKTVTDEKQKQRKIIESVLSLRSFPLRFITQLLCCNHRLTQRGIKHFVSSSQRRRRRVKRDPPKSTFLLKKKISNRVCKVQEKREKFAWFPRSEQCVCNHERAKRFTEYATHILSIFAGNAANHTSSSFLSLSVSPRPSARARVFGKEETKSRYKK